MVVATTIVKRGSPQWDNLTSPQGARAPAKRTGHVMVTYADKLFLYALPSLPLPSISPQPQL